MIDVFSLSAKPVRLFQSVYKPIKWRGRGARKYFFKLSSKTGWHFFKEAVCLASCNNLNRD